MPASDYYANFILGQLNPGLKGKTNLPLTRPSTVVDSTSAVYRKTLRTSMSTDIFDGVNTFHGVVLARIPDLGESIFGHSIAAFFGVPADAPPSFICFIPELHTHLPNPFSSMDNKLHFIRKLLRFPRFEVSTLGNYKMHNYQSFGIGSVLEIHYTDPNRTVGKVVRPVFMADDAVKQAFNNASRGSASTHASGATIGTPKTQADAARAHSISDAQLQAKIDLLIPGGRITSNYGHRHPPQPGASADHKGVDIDADIPNADITSPKAGKVKSVRIANGSKKGYGNQIVIEHADGTTTSYSHLSSFAGAPRKGASIPAGAVIGTMGKTGMSTGEHLHFEVKDANGKHTDPLEWLIKAQSDPAAAPEVVHPIAPAPLPF
jgi:hypothetical protein